MARLIVGNWKMHGSIAALAELDEVVAAMAETPGVDVAVCVPFTLIAPAVMRHPELTIGAQDCHWLAEGSNTGCVSPAMLVEAGARIVIVGHSERRTDNHETSSEVRLKAEAAIAAGLRTIVCVGETQAERDRGDAIAVVEAMVAGSIPAKGDARQLILAYEPVWAIGTGRTPTLGEVAEMHAAIRAALIAILGSEGSRIAILYGGSVKPANAEELLGVPDVGGALVGGASLKAKDFVPIIRAGRDNG